MQNLPVIVTQNITLGAVILIAAFLAFYKGRKILYSVLLAFFPAIIFYQALVGWPLLTGMLPAGFFPSEFNNRLILFALVFLLCLYIVHRVIGFDIRRYGVHKIVDSVFLAIGLVCESFVLIFHTLAGPDFYHFSSPVEGFLGSPTANIIMLTIALFSVLYSSRA